MFVTQTPHDEIFAQQTRAHAAYPYQFRQHHVHKALSSNSNEQAVFYYPIKNASARYSICTRREQDINTFVRNIFYC